MTTTELVVPLPDLRLGVDSAGEGPAVVCCHGFPDLAHGWRHLLPALAAAGFRALAPDQRGYGRTGGPDAVEAYDIHHLTGDLVGMLDALGIERAVFVGHDWGGTVAWMTALLHPTRVAGVIGVNTPHYPRPSTAPVERLRAMFGDTHYMVAVQQSDALDRALATDVRRTFTQIVRSGVPPDETLCGWLGADGRMRTLADTVLGPPMPGTPLLSAADLSVYVDAFTRTGFTGGLNWYRNLDRNWATTPHLAGARITVPALMVTAEWDVLLPPAAADRMRPLVPDLETVMLPRCGHWTTIERPTELARLAIDWLRRRFSH
jgi:pimeloyl-ACP methyl ester carboxylesterase